MDLIDQLKRDEGFRAKPYRDTTGHLTIGYGHNLDANGISQEVAALLLEEDIAIAVSSLRQRFDWFDGLSRPRQDALINMVFNLGINTFMEFHHMLSALDNGDFHTAALHILNSKYHDQVGARAERIAQQLETGEYV
jgi:lysozyme